MEVNLFYEWQLHRPADFQQNLVELPFNLRSLASECIKFQF